MSLEEREEQGQQELSDEEIAELANRELRKKNEEIKNLKKELNQLKLLSTVEEEDEEPKSREEIMSILGNNHTTNYDYAQAVVDLVDIENESGRQNPLGKNGEQVYNFFKDVIADCDGDKSRFPAIYQAKIGNDSAEVAMAYNKRNN